MGIYNSRSLQQQSTGRHVANPRHIILIPGQPVFEVTPYKYVLFGEAANTNFIVFGSIRPFLDLKIYSIQGTHNNNYTTDVTVYAFVSTLTLEH